LFVFVFSIRNGLSFWRFEMRKPVASLFALAALAAGLAFSTKAADNPAKITYAYFINPVEVPGGKVLQPGTYAFVMTDDSSTSNKIVEIRLALPGGTTGTPSNYNANKAMAPQATVLLVPDFHTRPGARAITLWPAKEGTPTPLRTLSFPVGQVSLVFVYPHDRAVALAKEANQPVASTNSNGQDAGAMKSASIKATMANGQDVDETQVFGKQGDQPPDRALGKGCNYEAGDVSCEFNPGEIRD
jgi:hypothetical protein